jgi:outer membrane murein-binding lipoprotein Lpp
MRFLDLSQRAEQDRIEAAARAEQERLAAKQRAEQERRRRRIVAAAIVVAVLGVFLGGFSIFAVIKNDQLQTTLEELHKQKDQLQAALAREAAATKTAEEEKARAQKAEAAAKQALADKEAAEREAATMREAAQKNIAEAAKGLGSRPTGTYANETKSFGVAAPTTPVKTITGPTPTELPGGKVLTTSQLWDAIVKNNLGPAIFLVDVDPAAHAQTIPGASRLPAAGQGAMDKATLNQVWAALSKLTGGNFNTAIVFFGAGVNDWTPYNAGLHAISWGYSKVFWYRGGIAAWTAASQPLK